MREHTFETHDRCLVPYCPICVGGLKYCIVCRCGEESLATECPGRSVAGVVAAEIFHGKIDYRDGRWQEPK